MIISTMSIICMVIAFLMAVGTPVGLFLLWRKKYSLKVLPMLVGAGGFTLFALILEQILHMIVLRPDASGNIALRNTSPFLYAVYGCLAAGVFEETARFICFKLLKKKYNGFGVGISYGIGHGGIEAVLLVGLTMISNIILAVLLNMGIGADAIPQQVISSLSTAAPPIFLVSGFERIMAITIHISLSVLVYYAVNANGKMWLYPAAILLHAIIDVPAVLMQVGALSNVYVVEGMVLLEAVALSALAVYTHKKLKSRV